jgi:two-component system chemotaxis response regulator CheY
MSADLSMPILVVEDFSTMSRIICGLLKKIGFQHVDEARDGATALAKMRAAKYRLVISDWNMTPMTGYDLLKAIRSDDALKKTCFIMMTAESAMDHVVLAKKAGVNSYIMKPFTAEVLKAKIDEVFAERSAV